MIVLKFGGTSVGSPERIKELASLIQFPGKKIIVLSAMSGTTNSLVEIVKSLYKKEHKQANKQISALEDEYKKHVLELFSSEDYYDIGKELLKTHFKHLRSFTEDMFTLFEEKSVLALGELLSTSLLYFYLKEQNIDSHLMSALNFMRINKEDEPDLDYIKKNLHKELETYGHHDIIITQGYICRNTYGEVDNLKRGGSDYSASLIGAAIGANEIQIWTDIDGMHNNDPRFVENTKPLSHLSFDEAAELAYFGAKILHPSSVLPAKKANIPVRLKNTMQPQAHGTLISSAVSGDGIKSIAAKDGITAIKIKSGRMLLAYGFLRKVFEIFETYKTPIDMITTSEVAVSVTIDDVSKIKEIVNELEKYGMVEVESDLSIICVVGDFIAESKGYAVRIFDALRHIPIRMISYGGSRHNVSLLVQTDHKNDSLVSLHQKLF